MGLELHPHTQAGGCDLGTCNNRELPGMNLSEIANKIDELTGSWSPSGAATAQDLRDARLRLADGLFSNTAPQASQSPSSFRSRPAVASRSEADAAAELATSASGVMPYVRNATDIDPAANANVVGMKVDKTLGPFVDSFGVAHWVDLIPVPHQIPISSATRGILGFLIIDVPSSHLGPGSIWISASAFNVPQATGGRCRIVVLCRHCASDRQCHYLACRDHDWFWRKADIGSNTCAAVAAARLPRFRSRRPANVAEPAASRYDRICRIRRGLFCD